MGWQGSGPSVLPGGRSIESLWKLFVYFVYFVDIFPFHFVDTILPPLLTDD